MKALCNLFRIILGIVFVFSGFVKVVDPMGVQFKFVDYFVAMGLDFLEPTALTLGIIMSAAELLIGISLLFNIKPRMGAGGVMLFMIVFLPLTLWIAIADPVQDCGCFGDAIILSNWTTFWKNVVIMAMTVPVFLRRKDFKPNLPQSIQWTLLIVFSVTTGWLSIYCYRHLPILDFRPYKIGNNIQAGMEIPDSEKDNLPEYETVVVYKNTETGNVKEFDVNNIPEGEEWEWQETKNKLVKEGYEPPIHDFSITTMPLNFNNQQKQQDVVEPEDLFNATYLYQIDDHVEEFPVNELPLSEWSFVSVDSEKEIQPQNVGLIYEKNGDSKEFTLFDLPMEAEWRFVDAVYYNTENDVKQDKEMPEDITDLVLADERYTFFIISWDIMKVKNKDIEKLSKLYNYCDINNMRCLFMTSSTEEDVMSFVENKDAYFDFYSTDPITLKTMARSNPCIMLVKKGTILNKWPYKDFPGVDNLSDHLVAQSMQKQVVKSDKFLVWMIGFGVFLFYVLIHIFINYLRRKNILNEKRSWE